MPERKPSRDMQARIDAVRQLLNLFQLERMVYISITLAALLILLCSAVFLFFRGGESIPVAIGLFGASGAITYTTSRLLRMWNQAFEAILGAAKEDSREPA